MTEKPQRTEDTEFAGAEVGHREGVGRARAMGRGSWLLVLTVAVGFGLLIGFVFADRSPQGAATSRDLSETLTGRSGSAVAGNVNLPQEYDLGVSFGDIGPQLLAAGAIDLARFVDLYQSRGQPLTESQLAALADGSQASIAIDDDNAYFLLNFFWALGLTNRNPLLEEGPMMAQGEEEVGRFASTGGWTLGTRSPVDLYSSTVIVALTPEQQARLEEVASGVYRPCCDNPTSFPDCNHGMAMLGLLELMASEDATVDEMFTAAKNVNAFWFPQQTAEVALLFQHAGEQDFDQLDAREFVGFGTFSASGFQAVHQWLADNGLLGPTFGSGGGCGV